MERIGAEPAAGVVIFPQIRLNEPSILLLWSPHNTQLTLLLHWFCHYLYHQASTWLLCRAGTFFKAEERGIIMTDTQLDDACGGDAPPNVSGGLSRGGGTTTTSTSILLIIPPSSLLSLLSVNNYSMFGNFFNLIVYI